MSAKVNFRNTLTAPVSAVANAANATANRAMRVVGHAGDAASGFVNSTGITSGITGPAAMMLVAYCIMAIVIVLPFEMPVYDEQTGEYTVVEYNFGHRLIMLLFLAIPVIASVYSVQCMVVGECTLWSYIVSLVHIFWVAVFVLVALMYAFRNNKAGAKQ